MARRIRWQIITTLICSGLILFLLGHLALATTAQGNPSAGGTYREALVGTIRDLDPLRGQEQLPPEADVTSLLFEGLVRVESTGIIAPNLASGWQISPDQRTYTVTLRTDARWHDDQPFTSADVSWTIGWIQGDAFSGDPALAALWRNIRLAQVDDFTVRFDLPSPFAPFLSQLDLPMTPAHLLRDADAAARAAWAANPVATGPYRIVEHTTTLVRLEAVSSYRPGNTDFEASPLPNLKVVEFQLLPTLDEAHLALRRGSIDALAYNVTEQPALPLPAGYSALRAPLADYVVLTFNTREPPLTDQPVRQALSYAIDTSQVITQALAGNALALNTPILPSSWAYDSVLTPYQDDPAHTRSQRLLDDAGWTVGSDGLRHQGGATLEFTLITSATPERTAVASTIADQLRSLGIAVTIEPLDSAELAERLRQHTFSLAIHGWSNLGSDPDQYELWHSSQIEAANFSGIQDDILDQTLLEGREETNINTRTEAYARFQERWLDLAPAVLLYQPLLEEQIAPSMQIVGLAPQASEGEVLFHPADRFRRLANWYQITTRQVRSDLRPQPDINRPR